MLAVTTRNQLRSIRFCLPMLLARQSIARQLAHQPGLVRYASVVSRPTEFFTLTVWTNRESMQRFMQTGAHEQHMWLFARWSASFWGMRWEPTSLEWKTWSALALAREDTEPRPTSPLVVTGILPAHMPRAVRSGLDQKRARSSHAAAVSLPHRPLREWPLGPRRLAARAEGPVAWGPARTFGCRPRPAARVPASAAVGAGLAPRQRSGRQQRASTGCGCWAHCCLQRIRQAGP